MTFEQWWTETKANFPALTNKLENSHLTESFEYVAHAAWIASREDIFKRAYALDTRCKSGGIVTTGVHYEK